MSMGLNQQSIDLPELDRVTKDEISACAVGLLKVDTFGSVTVPHNKGNFFVYLVDCISSFRWV
jgi:hypothetical protein